MHKRIAEKDWDPTWAISRDLMNKRIQICINHFGWQHAAKLIVQKGMPFHTLKIAEVGCGSGTTALAFCLLGASITLLDFNQRVLYKTQEIYNLFDCKAELLQADCMNPPVSDLRDKFDIVISSGLAEHFIGEDRETCIRYHRLLLKKGGFAYIGVPNKLSLFYQWVRWFRKLTGTWGLEVEIPFSPRELKSLAKKVGFKDAYSIGNAPLTEDCIDYIRGFGSAVKQLLPDNIKERFPSRRDSGNARSSVPADMQSYCHDTVAALGHGFHAESSSFIVNNFSAGIVLFAFK